MFPSYSFGIRDKTMLQAYTRCPKPLSWLHFIIFTIFQLFSQNQIGIFGPAHTILKINLHSRRYQENRWSAPTASITSTFSFSRLA